MSQEIACWPMAGRDYLHIWTFKNRTENFVCWLYFNCTNRVESLFRVTGEPVR